MLAYLHIAAGAISLLAGTVAFSTKKGAFIHKKSGLVFVISMLIMSLSGAMLAAMNGEKLNIVAGCVTFYLVSTAYMVVHPMKHDRLYSLALMAFGLITGVSGILIGASTLNNGVALIDGQPAPVIIVFGSVALLAALSDIRILRFGRLKARPKLIRHIWRIGVAMFISTSAFFLGQAQVFPEVIRILPVLVTPVLLVILLTLFWTVRVKFWGLKSRE